METLFPQSTTLRPYSLVNRSLLPTRKPRTMIANVFYHANTDRWVALVSRPFGPERWAHASYSVLHNALKRHGYTVQAHAPRVQRAWEVVQDENPPGWDYV